MKKFALIISMLAFAAITIFFISCIKNKKECKSCKMNPNFSLTNTEFFGNSYDFKMYTSSNNDFYFQYKKETDFSKLGDFFAQMNIEKLLDIELGNASINSIVVFFQ